MEWEGYLEVMQKVTLNPDNSLLVFETVNSAVYNDELTKMLSNRSQVQGSTFRVKDKEGIEDSKCSLQMFIFPGNCQFSFKCWIRPDETDAFIVNTHMC